MKYSLLPLLLSLSPFFVNGQTSSSQQIDLEADSGHFDQLAGRAIYEGNVKVTQGVATIWTHSLTITTNEGQAEKLEAKGTNKKRVKFEYRGEKQPIIGLSDSVIYHVNKKMVTLQGNAEIKQGKDTITGSQLTYHLDKEVIKGSKVRMTFQPKQQ